MECVSPETAVVLVLGDGPASGSELARGIGERLGTGRALSFGTLHPLLERLRRSGLVRSWTEGARSRVGRPRRFHELTAAGVETLEAHRTLLRRLAAAAAAPWNPSTAERRGLRRNLGRGFAASALGMRLRTGLSIARPSRGRARSR